jgi:hypothetical protein
VSSNPDLPAAWFSDYRWVNLPDAGKVVHLYATMYCWERNNDGHVPFAALRFCHSPKTRTLDRLVASGLWQIRADGDGYQLDDYRTTQRTKKERDEARQAWRESSRKRRANPG